MAIVSAQAAPSTDKAPASGQFSSTPTPELQRLLREELEHGARAWLEAGQIFLELERRSAAPALPYALQRVLRLVGGKKLAAELVPVFPNSAYLECFADVPLREQRAIAKSGMIRTVEHDQRGEVAVVDKPISRITLNEFSSIFDRQGRRMRSIDEQTEMLSSRRKQELRKRGKIALNIRPDVKAKEIIIGRIRVRPHELASALTALGFELIKRQQ